MIYIFLLLLILIGIYLYDVRGGKRNKVEFFYFVIFLLSITTGLSYRLGIDMTRYMDNYVDYKSLFKIDSFDYFFSFQGEAPLWVFTASCFRTFGLPFFIFHLFQTLFINSAIAFVIRKYAACSFVALLLYVVTLLPTFNYEIMRESLAVATFLYAVPYLLRSQYIHYYCLAFIAFGFHLSAFVVILVPLVKLIPNNKLGLFVGVSLALLILFFADVFRSQLLMLLDIDIFADKTLSYFSNEKYSTSSLSISFLFNLLFYILLPSFLYIKYVRSHDVKKVQIFRLVLLYIFVYCCTIVVPIFYRINNYFTIFFLIYLSGFITIKERLLVLSRSTTRFLGYISISLFIFMKIHAYCLPLFDGCNLPSFVRYYPYSSIFTKQLDKDREKLYLY